MRFNLLPIVFLFVFHVTTQLNGQELERTAIQDGTFRISYKHGSTYELVIKDGRYTRISESGERHTGDINIDEDSFSLYPDEPDNERNLSSIENNPNSLKPKENQLIANPLTTPLRLPPCNWHELNRPNRRTSKFIVYSPGGIRIQCASGRIRRLRTK